MNVEELEKLRGGEYEDEVYAVKKTGVGTDWTNVLEFTTKDMPSAIIGIALNNSVAFSWDIYREGKTVFPGVTQHSSAMRGNMEETEFFIPVEPRTKVTFRAVADTGTVDVSVRLRLRYFRK